MIKKAVVLMHSRPWYVVNAITLYRLVAAPLLLLLVIQHNMEVFRWLLPVSFFTDAIDGYFARRYKVVSALGAMLDSIADDLTVAVAVIGMFVFKPFFFREVTLPLIVLLFLFIVQVVAAFIRYGKMTSFHTYAAKTAAVLQGIFLILLFFIDSPGSILFYVTVTVTALQIAEEIVLVLLLPRWKTDVKGLYWVLSEKRGIKKSLQT